jgi:MoxR-like ATPase
MTDAKFTPEEKAAYERLLKVKEDIYKEISKVIIGQKEIIDNILITLFSRGHALLIGVPGLAKTLMIKTLSQILDLNFSRIQFTPDLMPSDITGTEIIEEDVETGKRHFKFVPGPLFANLILADEINRTPPKTQSALLQAMQEYEITSAGKTYPLEKPFFVLATQNPIEQEGTYPLPEAQLDRFMLSLILEYPTYEEEVDIVRKTTVDEDITPEKILSKEEILELQNLIRKVPVSDKMYKYAVNIVRQTRPQEEDTHPKTKEWLVWGAGPRACQYIIIGAKARAVLSGKEVVSAEDIEYMAYPVLQHRIITNFNADAAGIKPKDIIKLIIEDTTP